MFLHVELIFLPLDSCMYSLHVCVDMALFINFYFANEVISFTKAIKSNTLEKCTLDILWVKVTPNINTCMIQFEHLLCVNCY